MKVLCKIFLLIFSTLLIPSCVYAKEYHRPVAHAQTTIRHIERKATYTAWVEIETQSDGRKMARMFFVDTSENEKGMLLSSGSIDVSKRGVKSIRIEFQTRNLDIIARPITEHEDFAEVVRDDQIRIRFLTWSSGEK